MQATVSQVPDPFLQGHSATITQVAVFEAVNAIVGDYQPYLGSVTAPPGASPEAAAVAAAHRALVRLHPDQAASLGAHRVASLAAIADGPAKDTGIAVGEAAALAVLATRTDDGSNDDTPYTPGTAPGRYRPTPPDFTPAFRPGLGQVDTFAIKSGAQFRVDPPPALHSARYTRDYDEVKQVGELHSTNRPPDRAAVARFYAVNDAVQIYFPAARQVSQAQGRTLAENARNFALLGMAIFDAVVTCFDSKYLYDYWRPVTAIHLADHDGNPKTEADANWASFVPTPPFPSYPSGHAAFGAAARRVLERTLGPDGHAITLASPLVPDVVLRYTSWKQITDDVDDARIYGGVHYRFDQEAAAQQGRRVGSYVLRHWLRSVHRHNAAAPPTPLRPRLEAAPNRAQQNHPKGDPMTQLPAVSHVALTVANLAASIPWYECLLGTKPVLDEDTGGFHHTVYLLPGGTLLALHQHPATGGGDRFDEHRPGLDHLSFGVADRAELKAWQARLEELGIPHGGIVDAHYGSSLSFRDPDNIALELFAPPG